LCGPIIAPIIDGAAAQLKRFDSAATDGRSIRS
jgi:hypothetical protein